MKEALRRNQCTGCTRRVCTCWLCRSFTQGISCELMLKRLVATDRFYSALENALRLQSQHLPLVAGCERVYESGWECPGQLRESGEEHKTAGLLL